VRRGMPVLVMAFVVAFLLLPIPPAFAPCHSISFSGAPYTVGEGAGKVTITVTNGAGAQTSDQMVDYETINGAAQAGSDYQAKSGTLTIPTGSSDASFQVTITNDSADEPNEQFTVQLSNVRPASSCAPPPAISDSSTTVTITDNDAAPIPLPSVSHSTTPRPQATTPRPTVSSTPTPTPTVTRTPSPTPTATPTPTDTGSPIAAGATGEGGLSAGAVAGIIVGALILGGGAAFWVRRRFLT
jgi:hypothetical protein